MKNYFSQWTNKNYSVSDTNDIFKRDYLDDDNSRVYFFLYDLICHSQQQRVVENLMNKQRRWHNRDNEKTSMVNTRNLKSYEESIGVRNIE